MYILQISQSFRASSLLQYMKICLFTCLHGTQICLPNAVSVARFFCSLSLSFRIYPLAFPNSFGYFSPTRCIFIWLICVHSIKSTGLCAAMSENRVKSLVFFSPTSKYSNPNRYKNQQVHKFWIYFDGYCFPFFFHTLIGLLLSVICLSIVKYLIE